MKQPSSDEYPITFDRALRIAVGGRDVPNRFHIFRQWWKSSLLKMSKATRRVMVDNTDEVIQMFRDGGVDESWLKHFCSGVSDFKAQLRSEQARAAINARWAGKKHLAGPKVLQSNIP